MRDYKFRGKDIKTQNWVYGSLLDFSKLNDCPQFEIYSYDEVTKYQTYHKVYDIGQFTGLTDKNGKEIYDGDIVINHWHDYKQKLIVKLIEPKIDSSGWLSNSGIEFERVDKTIILYQLHPNCFEIIGNIYENPEFLEVTTCKQ
jgi:uncharacterized phage protein (TIGR01671 family)